MACQDYAERYSEAKKGTYRISDVPTLDAELTAAPVSQTDARLRGGSIHTSEARACPLRRACKDNNPAVFLEQHCADFMIGKKLAFNRQRDDENRTASSSHCNKIACMEMIVLTWSIQQCYPHGACVMWNKSNIMIQHCKTITTPT